MDDPLPHPFVLLRMIHRYLTTLLFSFSSLAEYDIDMSLSVIVPLAIVFTSSGETEKGPYSVSFLTGQYSGEV